MLPQQNPYTTAIWWFPFRYGLVVFSPIMVLYHIINAFT